MAGAAPLVFITGASSGIGQALAARYAAEGWRLALLARRADSVQAWADAQRLGPERCAVYAADVRDSAALAAAAQRCLATQGLPDVVIANAGISIGIDPGDAADLAVLQDTLATNVLGLAASLQPFVEPMKARRSGTLVGVASVAGVRGLPGHGAYCASKAAAIAYCESLRGDVRGHGLRVVTLLPGFVRTPLTQHNPYFMPFLLGPDEFARRAFQAIRRGRSYCVIPRRMGFVACLLRLLPNPCFDRLLAGRPRKPRRSG